MPPLSGFVAKLSLIVSGFAAHEWPIVTVSIVVSLLTLFTMMRIWIGVFWAPQEEPAPVVASPSGRLGAPAGMVLPTAALVVATLVIAFAAGPIFSFCERTAHDLNRPGAYTSVVLGR